tara:strand:+ start:683 stop:901 length:219 start_codon:yes stop_codon:yes gene_type:complete
MAQNLHKMIDTQTMLQNVDPRIITSVVREKVIVHKVIAMRTRRLSRAMLKYSYRPKGRMFAKTMEAMLMFSR